jgi:hypothetical protein
MDLKSVKEQKDKTPIDGIRGIVEKQYPPNDPTENDIKWKQHRQSLLIHDDEGNKVMVTLMKQALHVLDPVEGHEMVLSAGRNDSGELRGLLVNRWRQRGKDYDSIVVKVYPEATLRLLPPGGSTMQEPAPSTSTSGQNAEHPLMQEPDKEKIQKHIGPAREEAEAIPAIGTTQFEKEMALVAYGYRLCLDKAQMMVSDRPLLQSDPGSVRAIATNLWMSTKHHVHTLAPGLNKRKEVSKGAAPKEQAKPTPPDDRMIIDRCINGHRAASESDLSENAIAALAGLDSIMDERQLWEKAYDQLVIGLITSNIVPEAQVREAANQVYDDHRAKIGPEANIDKYFVCGWSAWREIVLEQIGRNEG